MRNKDGSEDQPQNGPSFWGSAVSLAGGSISSRHPPAYGMQYRYIRILFAGVKSVSAACQMANDRHLVVRTQDGFGAANRTSSTPFRAHTDLSSSTRLNSSGEHTAGREAIRRNSGPTVWCFRTRRHRPRKHMFPIEAPRPRFHRSGSLWFWRAGWPTPSPFRSSPAPGFSSGHFGGFSISFAGSCPLRCGAGEKPGTEVVFVEPDCVRAQPRRVGDLPDLNAVRHASLSCSSLPFRIDPGADSRAKKN